MTPERAKELLPIIQAYAEGKTIQWKSSDGTWRDDLGFDPSEAFEYRIKSEPREWWIWNSPDGELLCREIYPHEEMNRAAIKVREVLE